MINSFWNICSTCPMSKEEKLNSEYKRNFVWHPNYRALPQDVITTAPHSGYKEAVIQRKKQYPDLAYKSSEVIGHDMGTTTAKDCPDLRARSEERGNAAAPKSGPRSRSAEPSMGRQHQKLIMVQSYPPIASGRAVLLPETDEVTKTVDGLPKTTEYQSQFAWPKKSANGVCCTARKSLSMGIIKGATEQPVLPPRPKPKLEPMVHMVRPCAKDKDESERILQEGKRRNKTEYKSKYKPFTSYVYVDGQWKKTSRLVKVPEKLGPDLDPNTWYSEVMERLQKANEYRCRGHNHTQYGQQLPQIPGEQAPVDLSPQVRHAGDAPETMVHFPRLVQPIVQPEFKKAEVKKREKTDRSPSERKKEKDKKSPITLNRPKSAEPAKAKEEYRQAKGLHRPATTPPARPHSVHQTYSRKSPKKEEVVEKRTKSSSRPPIPRKPKEERSQTAPSSGRKGQCPPQSSRSSGKVWLQAGAPVQPPPAAEGRTEEHTDAVRPSTLLPPPKEKPEGAIQNGITEELEKAVTAESKAKVENASESPVPTASVVPLTNVRTPEEVTGVKSPDPEFWTVPMDSGQKLQWSDSNAMDSSSTMPKVPCSVASPEMSKDKVNDHTKLISTDESDMQSRLTQQVPEGSPGSARMNTTDVLDRARSRLDQFWGKNK